jgi:hypothetical protein
VGYRAGLDENWLSHDPGLVTQGSGGVMNTPHRQVFLPFVFLSSHFSVKIILLPDFLDELRHYVFLHIVAGLRAQLLLNSDRSVPSVRKLTIPAPEIPTREIVDDLTVR